MKCLMRISVTVCSGHYNDIVPLTLSSVCSGKPWITSQRLLHEKEGMRWSFPVGLRCFSLLSPIELCLHIFVCRSLATARGFDYGVRKSTANTLNMCLVSDPKMNCWDWVTEDVGEEWFEIDTHLLLQDISMFSLKHLILLIHRSQKCTR